MLRKQLLLLLAVICVIFSGSSAFADDPCTRADFGEMLIALSEKLDTTDKNTDIPEEYNGCSKALIKAASKGLIPVEDIRDGGAQVVKQDAARLVYGILVNANPEISLTADQAEEILNSCYDNAYLKDENKIPYASLIRHGVIGIRGQSNLDEIFTKSAAETFMNRIHALFEKKYPVTVGGKTISIGSSVNEVFTKLGDPARIEKTSGGISWYVFNSSYLDFITVGIKDDMVCGYFSNAASLEYTNAPEVTVIHNSRGEADAVYCGMADTDTKVQTSLLTDIINAYRAKNGLIPFVTQSVRTAPTLSRDMADRKVVTVKAENFIDAYRALLTDDDGDGILSHAFGMASEIYSRLIQDDEWEMTAIDAKNTVVTLRNGQDSSEEESYGDIDKIRTPELVAPSNGEKTEGGSLTLSLKRRAADKYLVKLYNCEKETYDVFAYITCKKDKITIPSYVLTNGNVYRACIIAVSEDKELTGNTVEFTHGNAQTRVSIVSPEKNLSTYDDELEISIYSSAYRDFRVDVYDMNNKAVATKDLKGTNQCILEALPPGIYHVCATAISHADGAEKGNAFTTVQIKQHTPIINEFILEPGEEFEYYYGDGEKWIYFYDTETIAVTEDTTETIVVPDMAGEPDPAENVPVEAITPEPTPIPSPVVTKTPLKEEEPEPTPTPEPSVMYTEPVPEATSEPAVVYKTKITQRIVPSTKKYRALAALIPQYKGLTGSFISRNINGTPTETGNAIAAMAMSYQGVPYVWGGTSPTGFDCSGLVKYVCNSLGIKNVARTSREQFAHSGVFVDKGDLIPGDLVFFQKDGVIHHVGIYIGSNMMVHAPHTGDVVKISSLQDNYYQREYAGAKRVS